jgi:CDP-2,3-bis-(O-geranylgeranyl)-sn-glycerol synthase
MSPGDPAPFAAALFLLVAMSAAGAVHVLWLRSAAARRWTQPVDGGLTVRGRRLFGPNKMLRGFVAMPLAGGLFFALFGASREALPVWLADGLWRMPTPQYAVFGAACGLAFMLAELPNSFVKRQLGVAPGLPPASPRLRAVFFVVDRCDSVLGVLIVASLLVPLPAATWGWVLLLGPCVHAIFSVALHRLGVKARAL